MSWCDEGIVIDRVYFELTRDLREAVLLSLMAQREKDEDGWFSWTYDEMHRATCLSRSTVNRIRSKFIEMGILEERRAGVPARMFYRLNYARIAELSPIAARNGEAKTEVV